MAKQNTQIDKKIIDSNLLNLVKELKPNKHLLHLSVLRQLSNDRAGTASTKTKSEVRGGGKKPWKQKGTGRARAGSIRSPLWVGGGITFGPKPRDFSLDIPRKASRLALAQAFAAKAQDVVSLKSLPEIKDSKTKSFLAAIKSSNLMSFPLLIIASKSEKNFEDIKRSSKNVQGVTLLDQNSVGVYDIMKANVIALTDTASEELKNRLHTVLGKENESKEKKKVEK